MIIPPLFLVISVYITNELDENTIFFCKVLFFQLRGLLRKKDDYITQLSQYKKKPEP